MRNSRAVNASGYRALGCKGECKFAAPRVPFVNFFIKLARGFRGYLVYAPNTCALRRLDSYLRRAFMEVIGGNPVYPPASALLPTKCKNVPLNLQRRTWMAGFRLRKRARSAKIHTCPESSRLRANKKDSGHWRRASTLSAPPSGGGGRPIFFCRFSLREAPPRFFWVRVPPYPSASR